MDPNECLKTLGRHIQSFKASTFFLNGLAGSGKTHLLHELSEELVRLPLRIQAIGPIIVDNGSISDLGYAMLSECHERGFLNGPLSTVPRLDFIDSWEWLRSNAEITGEQRFVVLLDLIFPVQSDVSVVENLFSTIRFLEGVWNDRLVQPHIVVVGYWDHVQLIAHYETLNVSFPYTEGYNYVRWSGVSANAMVEIVAKNTGSGDSRIIGEILHELVGGHPGAAKDLLAKAMAKDLDLRILLTATHEAALNGEQGKRFVELWQGLSEDTILLLSDLLVRRRIVVSPTSDVVDSLMTAGLARLDRLGNRSVLALSSWYVELVVRLHAADLGIPNEAIREIILEELMPEISVINQEAYRIINDVENQARNYVITQLCVQQASQETRHILQGIAGRYNERTNRTEDVYQRSLAWKTRSRTSGMPADLNPLIAYCSTRDLAAIITELACEVGSVSWISVAKAIDELSGIRDAVMHNQLVDVRELDRLYALQIAILDALNEVSR